MRTVRFSLGSFRQINANTFEVADKNGDIIWVGTNPREGEIFIQGMYETAIHKLISPILEAEGYNILGVKQR